MINICVIIFKQKEKNVTRRTLKSCYDCNPDGAGFMFAHKERLHVLKGFNGFRHFYKTYRKYERLFPDSDFVIHMRIATSGLLNEENCHPFYSNNNIAFCHNGVLAGLGNNMFSDTYMLNEEVFKKFPENFLDIEEIRSAIESYMVDEFSKAVFMDNKGRVFIANEKMGSWDDGVWFSNKTHQYDGYSTFNCRTTRTNYAGYSGWEFDVNNSIYNSLATSDITRTQDYFCARCNSVWSSSDVEYANGYVYCVLCGSVLDGDEKYVHDEHREFLYD